MGVRRLLVVVAGVLLSGCGGASPALDAGAGGGAGGGAAGGGGGGGGGAGGGSAGPKTVFITRADYTGSLGGLTGADTLCGTVASAAGRAGTWRAYVASDTVAPASRFTGVGPWHQRLADAGTELVFASKAGLATGPMTALKVDEAGAPVGAADSWTGTQPDGTPDVGFTCRGFTSASSADQADVGTAGQTDTGWHHNGGAACDQRRHLICFEQ